MRFVRLRVLLAVVGVLALAAALVATRVAGDRGDGKRPAVGQSAAAPSGPSGPTGPAICSQAKLRSPYGYTSDPGPYRSGMQGLPTYGSPGTDYPEAKAGQVLPPGTADYQNWQLTPHTVYYLEPGVHHGSFSANTGDAFVGGFAGGVGVTLDGDYSRPTAIDSNLTTGEQMDVTIRYLTIQHFTPPVDQTAINQSGAGGWKLLDSTVTLNVPGGGMFAATDNVIADDCLTQNGQYGFQSAQTVRGDDLTGGPYNVLIEHNEISYNDTCDLSGLLNNAELGWKDHNPVPARYRNPHCGVVKGDGNEGGFKLWGTDGVLIRDNWIHHNWGVGGWADTNNANTTWTHNTITDNENGAIWEEISYNFSITDNYMARNNLTDGPDNPGFPMTAIYISESGSDSKNGGVQPCRMASCVRSGMPGHPQRSVISDNTLVDNGGGIFLWQNSNRHCNDGFDGVCPLTKGGSKGPFTEAGCGLNLPGATLDRRRYVGNVTGSPAQNYWDGCMWQTQNVSVTSNTIAFDPAHIPGCTQQAWPACGANGIFSQYGGPNRNATGSDVPTQLSFFQHNVWRGNVYRGPSTFYGWNQGNEHNPLAWADWTGEAETGSRCTTPPEQQSGACTGPFGQDAGSTFVATGTVAGTALFSFPGSPSLPPPTPDRVGRLGLLGRRRPLA